MSHEGGMSSPFAQVCVELSARLWFEGAIPLAEEGLGAAVVGCPTRSPALGTGARSGTRAGVQCRALPLSKAGDTWGEETIQEAGVVPAGVTLHLDQHWHRDCSHTQADGMMLLLLLQSWGK